MLRDCLDDAILVVAHPDDETLWFSSIVDRVRTVLVCFQEAPGQAEWSRGRVAAAAAYPLPNTRFLGMTESMAFQGADWRNPVENELGLALARRPGTLAAFDPERYASNFRVLTDILRKEVPGHRALITHNPWGEYGHEEHVQVHRAAAGVAAALDVPLWYSNYCSDRSYPLLQRHLDALHGQGETLPTNRELARRIEQLYRAEDCWTWPFEDYPYFPTETFFRAPAASVRQPGATAQLNFIGLRDPAPSSVPAWRRTLRRLRQRLR